MLGGIEVLIIVAAIVFLFGGKMFVDWVQKIKSAMKDLKEESKEGAEEKE